MKTFIIDKAPGKELISKIIQDKSFQALNEFYKSRVDWYGYPLIHDRLTTYGLFDDLKYRIPKNAEMISIFIDYAIEIANKESDERFINSTFLLLYFCQKGKAINTLTDNQIQKINRLTTRVQQLSLIPNLSFFWNQILDYCNLPKILFH